MIRSLRNKLSPANCSPEIYDSHEKQNALAGIFSSMNISSEGRSSKWNLNTSQKAMLKKTDRKANALRLSEPIQSKISALMKQGVKNMMTGAR